MPLYEDDKNYLEGIYAGLRLLKIAFKAMSHTTPNKKWSSDDVANHLDDVIKNLDEKVRKHNLFGVDDNIQYDEEDNNNK